ncbi:regulator of Vps4 activity in the MVB pathway-domain-containing protein [Thamnocephalis sphaerospora]|uniref:Regulator of Vps4 activity in the MVB pathway-domain-containing protein n=1 Tax=Thamnocephalis sphaerospora TaxID=78915 RepID=A0A4P9XYJ3_9FUNG|nr:regulator of Vps4 activity in the MVB pathway-domain-containing protein [Thamnocephalis sphaerospora]|eukprot:RKP11182.1 regulator of Vps4 activity in the MVB pathway-domain-containing protein [Thamnocephalis sphaerospora]
MVPFNPTRTKVQLKLAVNRLKLLQAKKTAINQQLRHEVAELLRQQKDESARIRTEHIIREDYSVEALEQVELYCELLLVRFGLLETINPGKTCDPGVEEAVLAVLYAAGRVDGIKELLVLRDLLTPCFGRDYVTAAMENRDHNVNERLVERLRVNTPEDYLVNRYLEEIALSYRVSWSPPDAEGSDDLDELGSEDDERGAGGGHRVSEQSTDKHECVKCAAREKEVKKQSTQPASSATASSAASTVGVASKPDAEADGLPTLVDLAARLEALKRH